MHSRATGDRDTSFGWLELGENEIVADELPTVVEQRRGAELIWKFTGIIADEIGDVPRSNRFRRSRPFLIDVEWHPGVGTALQASLESKQRRGSDKKAPRLEVKVIYPFGANNQNLIRRPAA